MSQRKATFIVLITIIFTLVSVPISLMYGYADISLSNIFKIFISFITQTPDASIPDWQQTVILSVRLPRIICGLFVGGALALCGVAMQGLFRNPLAGPGVLGFSSGAAVGTVTAIYLGLSNYSVFAPALLGMFVAGLTAFAVYAIAARRGQTPMGTLLLAGIAFNSFHGAITSFVLFLALGDYRIAGEILYWTLGGLDRSSWEHVKLIVPIALLSASVIIMFVRDLDALLLGETQAASVGVNVPKVRFTIIGVTALLTGTAVAISGSIAFVGLVIPHILRLIMGPNHSRLMPASIFAGAGFLVFADLFARTVILPEELRLGVVTAAIGAPFFIFLLIQRRKEGWW